MAALTVPPVVAFLLIGILARLWLPALKWSSNPCPMISFNFFLTLCFYLPWALLQQTLFQFYLLGRLRALLPFATPWMLSTINGVAYGLVHLPSGWLMTVVTPSPRALNSTPSRPGLTLKNSLVNCSRLGFLMVSGEPCLPVGRVSTMRRSGTRHG